MPTIKYLFLLTALAPLISAQCNYKTAAPFFRRSVYEFNLNLVRRINQETDSHFAVSALTPWTLLSTLSLGASDSTLTEIQDVLRMHPNKCFNNKFFNLAKQITGRPSNPTAAMLERSSTIFMDDTINIKESYINEVQRIGLCDAKVVSFYDTTGTSSIINDYVKRVTHEAIDEIVTPSDLSDLLLVLIDALYFKGAWKVAFPYDETESSAFYNYKGEQIGDVALMYVSGSFNVTSIRQIQAKVLELPYGDGSRYSMLVFLPYTNVPVSTVIDNLGGITLSSIFYLYKAYGPQTVDVQIPRFKISSDIDNLKELLIDMGLRSMFDSDTASFPGITDYMVSVTNLIQKVDIEVTEDGTAASSATAALFEARMLPEQFVANRPFLFMIVDRHLKVPIFTGAYSKPTNF